MNSIRTIDQMGEFIQEHARRVRARPLFGGAGGDGRGPDREARGRRLLPYLRGAVSSNRRVIAHYDGSEDALTFANSPWAEDLCQMGTSCPDHFLRTRISPMFIPWDPARKTSRRSSSGSASAIGKYREDYAEYYKAFAEPDSPALRDANPSVVVIPGLGLFGFGKDKREARITSEFFVNAIHVMAGANALEDGERSGRRRCRRSRRPEQATRLQELPQLRRAAADRGVPDRVLGARGSQAAADAGGEEFSRKVVVVVGGGSGIGREVALQIAQRGGHVVVADHEHGERRRDRGGSGEAVVGRDGAWRRRWI